MCKQICSQKVRYKKAFRPLTRKQFFFFLLLSRRILDLSPRFSLSKSPPKVGESIAQSIYNERKKSFLSSLDSILRQIGCLNRRDITKQIDETVTNCLASERESFLTQIRQSKTPLHIRKKNKRILLVNSKKCPKIKHFSKLYAI